MGSLKILKINGSCGFGREGLSFPEIKAGKGMTLNVKKNFCTYQKSEHSLSVPSTISRFWNNWSVG